jgi:hypothetical protein
VALTQANSPTPNFFFGSSDVGVVTGGHRHGLAANGAISTRTGAVALVVRVIVHASVSRRIAVVLRCRFRLSGPNASQCYSSTLHDHGRPEDVTTDLAPPLLDHCCTLRMSCSRMRFITPPDTQTIGSRTTTTASKHEGNQCAGCERAGRRQRDRPTQQCRLSCSARSTFRARAMIRA